MIGWAQQQSEVSLSPGWGPMAEQEVEHALGNTAGETPDHLGRKCLDGADCNSGLWVLHLKIKYIMLQLDHCCLRASLALPFEVFVLVMEGSGNSQVWEFKGNKARAPSPHVCPICNNT